MSEQSSVAAAELQPVLGVISAAGSIVEQSKGSARSVTSVIVVVLTESLTARFYFPVNHLEIKCVCSAGRRIQMFY